MELERQWQRGCGRVGEPESESEPASERVARREERLGAPWCSVREAQSKGRQPRRLGGKALCHRAGRGTGRDGTGGRGVSGCDVRREGGGNQAGQSLGRGGSPWAAPVPADCRLSHPPHPVPACLSLHVCPGVSAGPAPPWTVAASPTFSSPRLPCRLSGPLVTGLDPLPPALGPSQPAPPF